MKRIIFFLLIVFSGTFLKATTWNEPWQDSVIFNSKSFVLAKVKSCDETKGIKIKILKTLAGQVFSETDIEITDFSLLHLASYSGGEGPEFHVSKSDSCYFFISINKDGKYCIPTPTCGFAEVKDGLVYATYRHSYHMCLVPPDVYEKTMTGIFNHYHGLEYDKKYFDAFITTWLSKAPAGFDGGQVNTFFMQHVALESIYHLRITGKFALIVPFLHDTTNFHNAVSAARALITCNTPEGKAELLWAISNERYDPFIKVMCIYSLRAMHPTEMKDKLQALVSNASKEENGFGGDIMDPRVATYLPSVKDALEDLIKTL
jgi:hypothetical protein